jgi:hypothetical protein
LKEVSDTPAIVSFSPCRKPCTADVVYVATPPEREAPPATMVRVSVPLVRYLIEGGRNPAGWVFS